MGGCLSVAMFLLGLVAVPIFEGYRGWGFGVAILQALMMTLANRGWGMTQDPPVGPVKEVFLGTLFGSLVCVPCYFVGVWLAGK